MKQIFTLSFFTFLFTSSFSQITMGAFDMPTAGWRQRVAKDTLPLPAISFGSKGANQVYYFGNLVPVLTDTIYYDALSPAQAAVFIGADIAVTSDSVNYLYTKTTGTQKFDVRGIEGRLIPGANIIRAPYQTPSDIFRFVTQYGTNFTGNAALTKVVPGSDVGQPTVDSVRLTLTTTYTDTIDGWGKITTPIGSYKCLRKQRKEFIHTVIDIKDALFTFNQWNNVSNTRDTTLRYTYPTRETKGSVITFDYDSLDNVTGVTWSLIPPAIPQASFDTTYGGNGSVQFTDLTDGYPDRYHWDFGDGDTSNQQNPNHVYTANGTYYVCLTVYNIAGSNMTCDSVYITNVGSANQPPVAVDDTLTLLQATTVPVYHVASNDSDPDGDNICMTAVWGSPFVAEVIGGSCDMISVTPDSTFTGTDTAWYSLCDNGTPSLCDTGMIIFTVNPDGNLLPVASFTYTANICQGVIATNTSTNTDSLVWNFHDNTIGGYPDTTFFTQTAQYGEDGGSFEVCLTVFNQFGVDSQCASINLSPCLGISKIFLSGHLSQSCQ